MDWYRVWHGMPTDPKWRAIARKSGQRVADVIAVFSMMMDRASQSDDRGSIGGWDDEDVAAALDLDPEDVAAIREAMAGKVLDGDVLTAWNKRQPKREDNSAERVKKHRAAVKRDVTQCNAPEEIREDTEEKGDTPLKPPTVRDHLLSVLDEDHATAVIEHRRGSRFTPHAARLMAKQFSQTPDPNAAADEMILRGWRGFKASWLDERKRATGPPQRRDPYDELYNAAQDFIDRSASKDDDHRPDSLPILATPFAH